VNGVFDLFYLSMIEPKQREKIFEELQERGEPGDLRESVASLIRFLYLGLDADREWFEETLVHGISNAEIDRRDGTETYYGGASVNVDIDVNRAYDVDEIEERFRSGNAYSLTPTEIGVLVDTGRLGAEDLEMLEEERSNPTFGQPKVPVQDDEKDTE
jgi:hypothetical protein